MELRTTHRRGDGSNRARGSRQFGFALLFLAGLVSLSCDDERVTGARDRMPPHAIRDLAVLEADSTSVRLTWIAPEDDDTGNATSTYDLRYAASDVIPWEQWVAVPLPAPREPGVREDHRVSGLSHGSAYLFRIRAADAAMNFSAPSNTVSAWTRGRDVTPPARIEDLAMVASTESTVRLRWTAPGDDGDFGIAARYELRRGPRWDESESVPGLPAPSPAGSIEEFTVSDLEPAIDWMEFWIRSEDDAGNLSPVSNLALAFTVRAEDAGWSDAFGPDGNGMDWPVMSLLVYSGRLIAAGAFSRAGSIAATGIAAWDGSTWSRLGSGLNGNVAALALYNGDLVAGGRFTHAGGVETRHVARWDGAAWHPIGSGTNRWIRSLAVEDSGEPILYATDGQDIFRLDGQTWSALESPPLQFVTAIRAWEGGLYASGFGIDHERVVWIARFDGQAWRAAMDEPLPGGWVGDCEEYIECLAVVDGRLFAGWSGPMAHLSEHPGGDLGGDWPTVDQNVLTRPSTMDCAALTCAASYRGGVVAGGYFRLSGSNRCRSVAWFDGAAWNPLGSGIGEPLPEEYPVQLGSVMSAAEYQGRLYLAGRFRFAGGRPSANIAVWDPR